ncbi:hypothetical protein [Actinomadura sp. 3N508]|uniref:hypothetical protein n=1 Tax=Actinomadura sp. 3N508 TaxID=3375153 RepID=UPI00379C9F43
MTVPNVDLIDGAAMPQVGFGVFQVPGDEAERAVTAALHPYLQQDGLRAFHRDHGIRTEAWAPDPATFGVA